MKKKRKFLIFFFKVWLLALGGNLIVIATLIFVNLNSHNNTRKVHHFLMGNLAIADLCLGFYLAMLAVEDVQTQGHYYNFAVDWQTGPGCKIAGFLTVFASELSVFAMVMLSFEIWYNTRYGFRGRKLQMWHAQLLMFIGWIISLTLASLPLFGVSGYSATSTCLPLQVDEFLDRTFLVAALLLNLIGFLSICASYVGIDCKNSNISTSTITDF